MIRGVGLEDQEGFRATTAKRFQEPGSGWTSIFQNVDPQTSEFGDVSPAAVDATARRRYFHL